MKVTTCVCLVEGGSVVSNLADGDMGLELKR